MLAKHGTLEKLTNRLGRVTDMVGDVPHEPSVFGIRVRIVVELDVVGARSVRVGDLRLRLSAGTADDVRCAMYVRIVNNAHSTFVFGPEWSGVVVPSGAVLWAGRPLLAPWSRVERCWGWATLLAPWSRVERCCGLGDPISPVGPEWSGAVGWATLISPVVPSGAVLWAGRPLLAPWSRVERCCGLGDPY